MVKERLLACISCIPSAPGNDFLPLGGRYWKPLAAARGYILAGQLRDANNALDCLQQLHGQCWPLEQARELIAQRQGQASPIIPNECDESQNWVAISESPP